MEPMGRYLQANPQAPTRAQPAQNSSGYAVCKSQLSRPGRQKAFRYIAVGVSSKNIRLLSCTCIYVTYIALLQTKASFMVTIEALVVLKCHKARPCGDRTPNIGVPKVLSGAYSNS